MQTIQRNLLSSLAWALGGFILAGTVVSRFYTVHCQNDYLVIHTILEFISVFVSLATFSMVWLVKEGLDDDQGRFIVYFGISFLAIGCMDFLHTLSYEGMPIFITPSSEQKAIFLWLFSRYVMVASFLSALIWSGASKGSRQPVFLPAYHYLIFDLHCNRFIYRISVYTSNTVY